MLVKIIIFIYLFSGGIAAAAMTGEEIIGKSHNIFFAAGKQMKARIEMRLINPAGKERKRDMTMLRKNMGGDKQKYFIYFHSPGDVRGTTFMVWKYSGRDDDRWLFMPALNLVRRIAAKDSHSSFVGSDFTYEDISGRDLVLDRHTLLREEPCGQRTCYVVESIPQAEASFKRKLSWLDKKTFLPIKEEYHDLQGKLARIFRALDMQEVEGIPTVIKRTMENVRRGHRTEVVFKNITYQMPIPDDLFTERYLRRPPERWIR